MLYESLTDIERANGEAAVADNPRPYAAQPSVMVMQAFRIRSHFFTARDTDTLTKRRGLIARLGRVWGDDAKGLMERLRGDFAFAERRLTNTLPNPYLWGRDQRSRFENL